MYSSIPDHRRTDTVSPKLLRWRSTGQRGGSGTGCAVSEQTDSEEIEPDHPGGELLILAKHIVKQLRTDDVNRRLLTLPVHQICGMFHLL